MYAVIRSGGKQYRVSEGDVLRVEKLPAEVGETVQFDEVLMVGEGSEVKIGTPQVEGGSVKAEVLEQDRHRKVEVTKFKRRQGYRRHHGHRQPYTQVKITGINAG
ncbi:MULTISPECIES: 50S ribosomal protein L21 [unclassified Halorhodospira]|uniref:50S ribosomal protein L21 n=1 Tax=unclassified Halorhodospira TaxID=2626748 RepID=UPI001EE83D8C|nr:MULTISPECIES: 50S ribosomal protein L21 [unclassified Halorhodospira]MCG5539893.1 50S ribosomal protein L21 [Halorhodospira sp. M39old]MCG5545271.1 50S ribosomal protein L21 [Halorhodospira sp. M38]